MSLPFYFNKSTLIQLVRQRRILWDTTEAGYKNKSSRSSAWHEICGIMTKEYAKLNSTERLMFYRFIIKTWNNLKFSWLRNMRKSNAKKSRSASKPYIYHEEMMFLKEVTPCGRQTAEAEASEEEEEAIEENDSDSVSVGENSSNIDSKEHINLSAINQENAINVMDNTVKRQNDHVSEPKVAAYNNRMNRFRHLSDTPDDRHFAFFKSIHPTLTLLDDDQILQFQSGVINLLRDIKRGGRLYNANNEQPSSSFGRGFYSQPGLDTSQVLPMFGQRVISSSSARSTVPQPKIIYDPLETD